MVKLFAKSLGLRLVVVTVEVAMGASTTGYSLEEEEICEVGERGRGAALRKDTLLPRPPLRLRAEDAKEVSLFTGDATSEDVVADGEPAETIAILCV